MDQFKPVKDLTYNQAVSELESIVRHMQGEQCDIDALAALTRRAAELLKECRSRLTATETELDGILKGMQ